MTHDKTVARQTRGLRLIQASGLHRWLPPLGQGVIFAGHRVIPMQAETDFDPNRSLSITPGFLDELLVHLKHRGIPVIPLSEVVSRLQRKTSGLFACFTFDDGYADNFVHAFPVFRRHDVPFAVYLTTGLLDGSAPPWWSLLEAALAQAPALTLTLDGAPPQHYQLPHDAARRQAFADVAGVLLHADAALIQQATDQLLAQVPEAAQARPAMLSAAMINEMLASGLVEFGAHTVNHVRLGCQTDVTAAQEIQCSRDATEALVGRPVTHFAYPYGNASSYGPRECALSRQLGFETAVTTRKALLTRADLDRPFELPRVSLNGHFQEIAFFDVFLSGLPFLGERLRRLMPSRPPAEALHAG